jgi:hypothetical protein
VPPEHVLVFDEAQRAFDARHGKLREAEPELNGGARLGKPPFTHVRVAVDARMLAQTLEVLAELIADDPQNGVMLTVPVSTSGRTSKASPSMLLQRGVTRTVVTATARSSPTARNAGRTLSTM